MADLAIVKSEPIPLSITKSEPLSNAEGEALKQKGFFESAWDVVKSVPAAAVEMLTPHSRAEKEAQIQKALQFADRFVSAHQGGDEAAKKAANDELMLALPGGSTIYKAKEGNYAGAAGDIAGMAVLGGAAKAAANPAETAATVRTARTATSGFGEGFKESMSKAPPSKPGQIVGRIVGGVVGHKTIGGLEGSAGGGYAGGEIGSRLPAVPSAVRAGIGKAILRLQQENLPERPAPAWQRLAEVPENAPSPLADLSQKLQAIIDERNARALERQQTALPPALERMVTKAKEAAALTPEQEALASEILQNVEPVPDAAKTPTPVEAVAPAATGAAGVNPALLEEIAQGLAGKPYNELIPAHQKTVIEMARRMEAGEGTVVSRQPPPEEPPPAAAAAPLEPIPPAPPADTAAPAPEPPPAAPTNVFVKNNRLAKAVRAADRAAELGLTAKDIMQMDRDVFAAKVGEESISGDTMAMVRDKLRRREADAAKAAAPGPKPTPTAKALTDFEAEKAAKLRAKGEAPAPAEAPATELESQLAASLDRVKELRGEAPAAATIESDVESSLAARQPAREQPGSAGAPVSGPREPGAPVARGMETTVRVPGERTTYQGQYSVRELDDVHASHNAHTFEKNPKYQFRNDRDYFNPVNKERVVVNSKGDTFDPAYVLSDSPDATNGAPVIDSSGNVLGGNSRAMILDRVYKNNPAGAAAYRAELGRRAQQLGIDPEQIAGMKRPVLVRELSDAELKPQRAITDLNKTGTAALTAAERATADARMITPAAADYLATAIDAGGGEATLNDVLSGKGGLAIVNRLVDDGVFTMQERPNLIDTKTGAVTAAAKERISKLLLGQIFEDADQMTRTPAEVRNKLERTVSPILQSSQKRGFDIRPTVREALDVMEYARAHGITRMSDLVAQESMFGDAPKFSPQAADLAQFLIDSKPTAIAKAFRRYVTNAEPTMFGKSTPSEAFADAFGTTSPASTLGEMMQTRPEPPAAAAPRKRRSIPNR